MDHRWDQIDDPTTYYRSRQDGYALSVTFDGAGRGWVWAIKQMPSFHLVTASNYVTESGYYAEADHAITACQNYFDKIIVS